jgi:CarboxypepD_reg-like domain/TonB-dependent Receptor Plug Domain
MNKAVYKISIALLLFIAPTIQILAEGENSRLFTFSGYVRDSATGEAMIGATVFSLEKPAIGITTNSYGYFSISLPQGKYNFVIEYLGYKRRIIEVDLSSNISMKIEMTLQSITLSEVVISGEKSNHNIVSNEVISKLNVKDVQNIPVIFGESDILKTIQLLPGIESAGEGSSGFYVRGGGTDQNLILLDEAPIYNASHLLGFFSIFNSDAIKDISVYKGGFPPEYGGRLSSVIDVKMKDGNDQSYHVSGGIGLIASRIEAEGPIVKHKGSFMISARRTYADLFLKLSKDSTINRSSLYFYDINIKANYEIDDKDRIYLSCYLGRDNFGFNNNALGINWGNTTATLRWNHLISDKLFSNTSFIYSDYSNNLDVAVGTSSMTVLTEIKDLNFKEDLNYYLNASNNIKFGFNSIYHTFVPGKVDGTSIFHVMPMDMKYSLENAAYVSNDQTFSDHLKATYGLRYSLFSSIGPGTAFKYDQQSTVIDSTVYPSGKIYSTYHTLEPRILLNYIINDSNSIKASYTRTSQYLHLLSNTTSSTPMDLWLPSDNNIAPEVADQFSIGYFRNINDDMYEFSVELYYKTMSNQIDYQNGANLILNNKVESLLVFGKGWSYGSEFLLRKKYGRLTGWLAYTWSRSMRQFASIDGGQSYPAKQDRPNEISIVGIFQINKKLTVSATWVYYDGNAVTFPSGSYMIDGNMVAYYTSRDGYRMPAYHRMDVGLTWERKKTAKFESSWNFSIYNVYARENAYAINFQPDPNDPSKTEAVQLSLFRFVPSITYNFKF